MTSCLPSRHCDSQAPTLKRTRVRFPLSQGCCRRSPALGFSCHHHALCSSEHQRRPRHHQPITSSYALQCCTHPTRTHTALLRALVCAPTLPSQQNGRGWDKEARGRAREGEKTKMQEMRHPFPFHLGRAKGGRRRGEGEGARQMAAATGLRHSAAVGEDGSLFVWGDGYRGQLGTGDTARRLARRASPGCRRPCGRSPLGCSTRAS